MVKRTNWEVEVWKNVQICQSIASNTQLHHHHHVIPIHPPLQDIDSSFTTTRQKIVRHFGDRLFIFLLHGFKWQAYLSPPIPHQSQNTTCICVIPCYWFRFWLASPSATFLGPRIATYQFNGSRLQYEILYHWHYCRKIKTIPPINRSISTWHCHSPNLPSLQLHPSLSCPLSLLI